MPGVFRVASSSTRIDSTASRVLAGGSRYSGADSSATQRPGRVEHERDALRDHAPRAGLGRRLRDHRVGPQTQLGGGR